MSEPVGDVLKLVVDLNAPVLVETLLYGVHVVLFCISLFILKQHKRSAQLFIILSAFLLFAISTADIFFTVRLMVRDLVDIINPGGVQRLKKRIYPKIPLFLANNFIADLTLLYRCYMVLGKSKYLLIVLCILVVADTVWGFLALGIGPRMSLEQTFTPIYLWSVFALNIVITAVTVARIFWVSRAARLSVGNRQVRRYHRIIAILIESSAVYSGCLLAFLLLPGDSKPRLVLGIVCSRIVAIMPTLLIVQMGLINMARETSAHDFAVTTGRQGGTSLVLDTIVSSVDPALVDPEHQDIPLTDYPASREPPSIHQDETERETEIV